MINTFYFSILTPDKILYEGDVISVILPGEEGFFETLAYHAPLVALLKAGTLAILEKNDEEKLIEIPGGFYQFYENKGLLLTC